MKTKHIVAVILTAALLLILSGCGDNSKVTAISLSDDTKEILTGETYTLNTVVQPSDLKKIDLTWDSSNENIATVDGGTITAVKPGTANITVTSKNGCTDTCAVTIRNPIVAKNIELSKKEIIVFPENTYQLVATISPQNVDDPRVQWESSDSSIASVAEGGVITCKSVGRVIITASTSNAITAQCSVSVVNKTPDQLASLMKQQPLYVSSTKYAVQSSQWKSLYPDMLQAVISNEGKDTIRNAVVAFAAWDANNLPVKIVGEYDFYGGAYCPEVNYNDINLVPGKNYGSKQGFSLSTDQDAISTFKACVVSYETFSGTTWTNPYYEDFIKLYSGQILQ